MVSIINQPVDAEDIFLFRPDASARGSDRHLAQKRRDKVAIETRLRELVRELLISEGK
jgi:hypothetical protein